MPVGEHDHFGPVCGFVANYHDMGCEDFGPGSEEDCREDSVVQGLFHCFHGETSDVLSMGVTDPREQEQAVYDLARQTQDYLEQRFPYNHPNGVMRLDFQHGHYHREPQCAPYAFNLACRFRSSLPPRCVPVTDANGRPNGWFRCSHIAPPLLIPCPPTGAYPSQTMQPPQAQSMFDRSRSVFRGPQTYQGVYDRAIATLGEGRNRRPGGGR